MSKFASTSIEKSVGNILSNTFKKSPRLLFGVSGGPDSMALLYVFHKIGAEVTVVHINYGMRGEGSDLDQELVEGFCTEWDFECCSFKLDSSATKGENFQSWARNERYRIFRELKKEFNADAIVTAHHQDDQVETILQKLFRGSGPAAWQGMSAWDGELFRPLLSFSKQEILNYCENNNVPFRNDESNNESKYARNFIRNELSVELDQRFPGWKQNILEMQELGLIAERGVRHIVNGLVSGKRLDLKKYSELDNALKPSVLKYFVESNSSGESLTKGQLNELLKIEQSHTGAEIPITESISLVKDRDGISIKEKERVEEVPVLITRSAATANFSLEGFSFYKNDKKPNKGMYWDAGKIQWPLTVRAWEAGDRFTPLGMNGTQKVSDHLTNRKIRSSLREKALILIGSDSTIYAIIFPVAAVNGEMGTISEAVKCTSETKEYFIVTEQ